MAIEREKSSASLLEWARKEVPAVRYAVGVAGIAAAAAILISLLGGTNNTTLIVGLMFVGMVLLFVFSRLSQSRSRHVNAAGLTLMWAIVSAFVIFVALTVSAVTIKRPLAWAEFIGIDHKPQISANNVDELIKDIGLRETAEGRRSLRKLVALAASGSAENKKYIVKSLKYKLLAIDDDQNDRRKRLYRQLLMTAILDCVDRDMKNAFERGDLSDTKLVGMDFKGVSAEDMDFSDTLLIGSDFEGANLTGANFSGSFMRNVNFRRANLSDTNWSRDADWFNASGISASRLNSASIETMMHCPEKMQAPEEFVNYIEEANRQYGVNFDQWLLEEQQMLKGVWMLYSSAGGLCDAVRASKQP